jgi:hypothetical protein
MLHKFSQPDEAGNLTRAAIHKRFCRFGETKKTGSERIFLQIDFKISFFPFLQMRVTKNVSVWRIDKT